MVRETILQHWLFTEFLFPFILIFFIVFAILEKTKALGDDNKQVNAIIAFVMGLIFVGVVSPKNFVDNMVLFLGVSVVVVLVLLLLWGFLSGASMKENMFDGKYAKWIVLGVSVVAVLIGVLWAAGITVSEINDLLFNKTLSNTFWANVIFIVVIAVALAIVLKKKSD